MHQNAVFTASPPPVYQAQWPSSFAKFLAFLDAIVNFNAFGLFPLDCIAHTNFYSKMDVYVLGYAIVIVCALGYLALLGRRSGHRAKAMREIVLRALLAFINFFCESLLEARCACDSCAS